MPNINFTCPHCSHTTELASSTEGMKGNCPSCKTEVVITPDNPEPSIVPTANKPSGEVQKVIWKQPVVIGISLVGEIIPKLFTNCRSSWVCDLVNVFGFQQHEAATYIGHTKQIQEEHYLRIMEDEHREAMENWADSKRHPKRHPLCNTSYLYQMVYTALQNNLPELVPAAEKHATRIVKIGKKAMFRNQEVDANSSHPLILSGAESSGGGTRTPDTRIMIPVL